MSCDDQDRLPLELSSPTCQSADVEKHKMLWLVKVFILKLLVSGVNDMISGSYAYLGIILYKRKAHNCSVTKSQREFLHL